MSDNVQNNGIVLNSNAVKKNEQPTLLNAQITDNNKKCDEESKMTALMKGKVVGVENNEPKSITT